MANKTSRAVKNLFGLPTIVKNNNTRNELVDKFFGASFGMNGAAGEVSVKEVNYVDWLREFNTNPRLAGLQKIVGDNGVAEFGLYTRDKEGTEKRVVGHPLEEEIRNHSIPMFFSLWTAYRLMSGEVYIAYELAGGQPTDFKLYSRAQVTGKPGDGGNHYVFQEGSKSYKYHESQVIVDLDLDLNDPYNSGYGKATSLKNEIELDSYISLYMKQFYINSARADVYISPRGENIPEDTDLSRLASELNSRHKGISNAHRTAVLSFEADIQTVANSHRDMELLETRRALRDSSLQHFSIPPEIMGIIENSNKATVVAAEHIYAKQVRMPILHHFQDIINTKILPLYGDDMEIYFKFDEILPDDQEMDMKLAKEGREASSITINEHRELLGFPPLKGDVGNTLVGKTAPEEESSPVVEVEESTTDMLETVDYKSYRAGRVIKDVFGEGVLPDTEVILVEED